MTPKTRRLETDTFMNPKFLQTKMVSGSPGMSLIFTLLKVFPYHKVLAFLSDMSSPLMVKYRKIYSGKSAIVFTNNVEKDFHINMAYTKKLLLVNQLAM